MKSVLENKYYKEVQKLGLIDFYDNVHKIYKKLAALEKEGLKDSEEYNELVDLLPSIIEIEKRKFKKIDHLNSDELENFIDYVTSLNRSTESNLTDITDLFESNKIKRLIIRFRDYELLRIEPYLYTDEKEKVKEDVFFNIIIDNKSHQISLAELESYGLEYTGNIEVNLSQDIKDEIRIANMTSYYRDKIVNLRFLKKIEDEISKEQNKSVREALIDFKYNFIYSFYNLENVFANKKDLDGEIYLTKNIINLSEYNYPEQYIDNYSNIISYKIKLKIKEIKSKEYKGDFPTTGERLADRIDLLYIESLFESLITQKSLNEAKALINCSSNEIKNNIVRNNLKKIEGFANKTINEIESNKKSCNKLLKELKLKR